MSLESSLLESERLRQRCVEGELSPEELSSYLRTVDGEADWRDLALAFAEQQLIQQSILQIDQEPRPALDASAQQQSEPVVTDPVVTAASEQVEPQQQSSLRRTRVYDIILSVACVAVAATLGWQLGTRSTDRSQPDQQITSGTGQIPGSDKRGVSQTPDRVPDRVDELNAQPVTASNAVPVMDVVMSGPHDDRQIQIPVYEPPADVGRSVWSDNDPMSVSLESELADSGYEWNRKRAYVTFPLDDGRQIAVPIETIQVKNNGL